MKRSRISSLSSASGQMAPQTSAGRRILKFVWSAVAALALPAGVTPAAGQSGELFYNGLAFDALMYDSGRLYWKKYSNFATDPPPRIQRIPSGRGATHSYYFPAAHNQWTVRSRNLAVDPTGRVFWATGNQIVTLAADAQGGIL